MGAKSDVSVSLYVLNVLTTSKRLPPFSRNLSFGLPFPLYLPPLDLIFSLLFIGLLWDRQFSWSDLFFSVFPFLLQVLQINSTKGVVTPFLIRVLCLRWIQYHCLPRRANDFKLRLFFTPEFGQRGINGVIWRL